MPFGLIKVSAPGADPKIILGQLLERANQLSALTVKCCYFFLLLLFVLLLSFVCSYHFLFITSFVCPKEVTKKRAENSMPMRAEFSGHYIRRMFLGDAFVSVFSSLGS